MMTQKKTPTGKLNKRPNWLIVGIIACIGAFIFFQPFLGVICVAALISYVFFPFYTFLANYMSDRFAAILTMFTTFAIVIIPVTLVIIVAVNQGIAFANSLSNLNLSPDSQLYKSIEPTVDTINSATSFASGQPLVTQDQITTFIKDTAPNIVEGFLDILVGFANNISVIMTSTIIYGFLFIAFLLYRQSLLRVIHIISPFNQKDSKIYLERAGMIAKSSLMGQFLIAFTTALGCAFLLIFLGMGSYFLFFVIIFTLLGMVPLGSGILMIPIVIVSMLLGEFWPGFWVLVIYLAVVCNFETFLRPRVVPKKAKLLPALTTLSTFCGLYYFGILGIVYGPLIAILLITTIEIYAEHQQLKIQEA